MARALYCWLPLMAVVGFILVSSRPMTVHAQSSGDPLVLAFYYTWFDENTWTYDKLSDLPAQPYASRDRGVMGRQIDQAKPHDTVVES